MITMSHFPHLEKGEDDKNNNYLIRLLRLNELIKAQHTEQYLAHINAINNVNARLLVSAYLKT